MAGRRRALANDDPSLTPFARTLRDLIDARKLSDTRLCQMAGLPPSTLSRWITHTRRPTNVALLLDTAAAMELTRDEAHDLLGKAGYDLDAVLRYRRHDPRISAVAVRWILPDGDGASPPSAAVRADGAGSAARRPAPDGAHAPMRSPRMSSSGDDSSSGSNAH